MTIGLHGQQVAVLVPDIACSIFIVKKIFLLAKKPIFQLVYNIVFIITWSHIESYFCQH